MTTTIEWADDTWNPVRGRRLSDGKVGWFCIKVAPEGAHCYAERQNVVAGQNPGRCGNGVRYALDQRKLVEVFLDVKTLVSPLRRKASRKIFPCSMTDLYGDWVLEEWLDRIYAVMALTPQHFYIVLTKRGARRCNYLSDPETQGRVMREVKDRAVTEKEVDRVRWPLPNVIEMASFGTQAGADRELPLLLRTPCAMRGASIEPMLEEIQIARWIKQGCIREWSGDEFVHVDGGFSWVICGGESGADARPFDVEWAESLMEACRAAGVPFFMKQFGAYARDYGAPMNLRDRKGGDPAEWPEHLRVREFPALAGGVEWR